LCNECGYTLFLRVGFGEKRIAEIAEEKREHRDCA
jgi:hypothetical protein